ncbi:MAG: ATP synthase F1 subunit gamma [Candidatus Omnitrophica bacterium]|nr:ATP synthase F1 subunit gamma [Candidatus Omnitrophota bacterium]
MPQNLRQIKNRIRVIDNAHKVTSAMEMISVTKLNRTEKLLRGFKPYFLKLETLFNRIISDQNKLSSPFFAGNDSKDICLCLISSDSGLCGVHNAEILRFAEEFIKSKGAERVKVVAIGRRGLNHCKKYGYQVLSSYTGLNGRYSDNLCDKIVSDLAGIFLNGKAGEVFVAYTDFKTALIRRPTLVKFLNLEVGKGVETKYLTEPEAGEVVKGLVPKYLFAKMRLILLEAFTAEHSARTIAMKMATDNAEELSTKLLLLRNKVRQANITQDMLEIISSAEALKG